MTAMQNSSATGAVRAFWKLLLAYANHKRSKAMRLYESQPLRYRKPESPWTIDYVLMHPSKRSQLLRETRGEMAGIALSLTLLLLVATKWLLITLSNT